MEACKTKFNISDLHVSVDNKKVLKGVTLSLQSQETHAIMGPNGSGKSTLAKVIMGHPGYNVTKGKVALNGVSVLTKDPDWRSRRGIFLAFQYPIEVHGVNMFSYLRAIYSARFHSKTKKKSWNSKRRPCLHLHANGS